MVLANLIWKDIELVVVVVVAGGVCVWGGGGIDIGNGMA